MIPKSSSAACRAWRTVRWRALRRSAPARCRAARAHSARSRQAPPRQTAPRGCAARCASLPYNYAFDGFLTQIRAAHAAEPCTLKAVIVVSCNYRSINIVNMVHAHLSCQRMTCMNIVLLCSRRSWLSAASLACKWQHSSLGTLWARARTQTRRPRHSHALQLARLCALQCHSAPLQRVACNADSSRRWCFARHMACYLQRMSRR
jgi:hypothetical protein